MGYHELWANYLGISLDKYLSLNPKEPRDLNQLNQAKSHYPMQISEADPIEVSTP